MSIMQKMIGEKTKKIIDDYVNFSFNGSPAISLPYSNNKVNKRLAGLRAYIGKGTPEDIKSEIHILSLSKKIDPKKISKEEFKKFLVDNNLGIDCSGLVLHIINAFQKDNNLPSLEKKIKFPFKENIFRKIIRRFRVAQNTDVSVFASNLNSKIIETKDIEIGDIITIQNEEKEKNHIMFVVNIEKEEKEIKIEYIHSIKWDTDGLYNHGVRFGKIEIEPEKNIIFGRWTENEKTGEENKTHKRAKTSETHIRRII